jgi:orotidine-5'-phosphate decarboxylase
MMINKETQKSNRTSGLKIIDRLIISIDVSSKKELIKLCTDISNKVSTLKLGLELIYSCGLEIIKVVKSFGYKVMLDTKLHDIPNTVSKASSAITRLGADMLTVHVTGGTCMLEYAKKAIEEQSQEMCVLPPLIFGVTVLTSLDDSDLIALGYKYDHMNEVVQLAKIADDCNIDGLVCSPNEVEGIRDRTNFDSYIATPGIRMPEDKIGDQKRINTPYNAIKKGSDILIVGRSITSGGNITEKIKTILNDIERAL